MMDEEAKNAFLQMPIKDQLLAIIDGQTFIRYEISQLHIRIEQLETDLRLHRLEQVDRKNGQP